MNAGAVLWLAFTNGGTLILLIAALRSKRYWINACQQQVTKRSQERLPVDTAQIATVLEEHRIRWVLAPDPDRDERLPDVGNYLPECPTCGPMTGITDASAHQARVLAIRLNKGRLRTTAEEFVEPVQQPPAGSTSGPAPHPHRIEVEISGGRAHGLLNGDITFTGVCDAGEGSPCRMWCDRPDCREEAQDGHESHPLVDQGECGVISSLNADPSFIPEAYDGSKTQLRSGCIELTQDIDGVAWHYCGEIHMTIESLAEYHGGLVGYHGDLVELHGSLAEQSNNLTEYYSSLREYKVGLEAYKDDLVELSALLGKPPVDSSKQPEGPTLNSSATPSRHACAENCRHQCPECHYGLGSHLTCDPRCEHQSLALS